jgi:hypothetical protein
MLNRLAAAAAATLCLAGAPALAEDAITWKEDVRGWYIGVDDSIGRGCFMTAAYNGGTSLRVQFNPSADLLQFMIGNAAWTSVEAGKLYSLDISFGNRSPWTGDGEGQIMGDLHMLVLDVPFTEGRAEAFIAELKQMPNVTVEYAGRTVDKLELSGTFAAMDEVIACQAAMNEGLGTGAGGTDPFAPGGGAVADPFQ